MPTSATALEQALSMRSNSGQGARDLMLAYEQLTKRNSQKLKDSMKALKAVKTPQEFMELQQKLMTEGMADAMKDGARIGELTKAALTSALEPMRKKIGDLQAGAKR